MRLGLFLLALASCCSFATATNSCLVGNLLVKNDVIVSKSVESKACDGLCRKQTLASEHGALVLLSCEENKIMAFVNQASEVCSSSELETSCFCRGDDCNKIEKDEKLAKPNTFVATNIICYVGFYSNSTGATNVGDSVVCGLGNVCTSVSGVYNGYDASVYACMPQAICDNIFNDPTFQSGTKCTNVPNTNIQGCCCYDQDCRSLAPMPNPPTPSPWNKNNLTCYQGISINGKTLAGGAFSQCYGECGSARIRTTYNGQTVWGEVYVCDPVDVFTSLNLVDQCKNIDTTNINGVPTSLITTCACSTDKCLDPTVVPPVYPIKQLKCAAGLYNGSVWWGGEINCQGRCGSLQFYAANQSVTYFTCMPYDVCAGFGLESTEDVFYNPPQDDEISVYCCSANNNCNVKNPDILARLDTSVVSTARYPVLCYGGIWVNGVSISNGAYGLCQGECAQAMFSTQFAGNTHNATIYTCDPVSMCMQAGISNGCGNPIDGVTACCCDDDLCHDPNRGSPPPALRCYSGISIPQDNYNRGGDAYCDGWCGSLTSNVNGKNATVYYCAPVGFCRALGLGFGGTYGNCGSIPGADPATSGCCCSDSNNCLVPDGINVTALAVRRDPKIVCYEGFHLNGQNLTRPQFRTCDGDCVSIAMTGQINGSNHYAELFTCDPSTSCNAMGIRNNCSSIDGTILACCCDSDECINPMINRYPGTVLTCYVGIQTLFTNLSIGATVQCDGQCAYATAQVGSDIVTAFHCSPTKVCRSLGLDNNDATLYLDRQVTVGCCDIGNNCNTYGKNVDLTNVPSAPNEAPRACYSGVFVDNVAVSDGGWIACKGDCASVSLNTTINGVTQTSTIYSCDPSIVCRQLNTTNNCHKLEDGLEACCCGTDACLDPTSTPPRKPYGNNNNFCYVGIYSYSNDNQENTILNIGGEELCTGSCGSVQSSLGYANVTVYACVPNYVCDYLGLYDDCLNVYSDRAFKGCCCTNGPNCNVGQISPRPPMPPGPPRGRPILEYPITCPAGLIVDGAYVTPMQFQVCDGDCASITINSSYNNQQHVASLYTCDPSFVCHQLGVSNNCSSPEPGLTGCCCNTDACLDPNRNKTVPTPPLKCYVGIYSQNVSTGAEQMCDGKCASIQGRYNNDNVTVFACVPHDLCRSLEIYDTCVELPQYPEFRSCCCDNQDNCNVKLSHLENTINTTMPLSRLNDYPISCYSGLFLNGSAYASYGWMTCEGECAVISMTSTFRGQSATAALYTCDPSRVCRNLGITNRCHQLENGVEGCCCNTNGCLDPTKNPPKTPGRPLMCFAGLYSNYTNPDGTQLAVGAEIECDGACSSLSGIVNGYQVHSYHCVPTSVCTALELWDDCKRIEGDRQIEACCCDNVSNCNLKDTHIRPPPPPRTVDYAIACYSGLYVNGIPHTPITLGACRGQCSSVSLNTTYNGAQTVATLYGCDPTLTCEVLGIENWCHSPEPGVTGCCCNTDLCLDPVKNKTVPSGFRACFNGIYAQGQATGSETACHGKCFSLSSRVNNDNVTIFGCVQDDICRQMELYDECNELFTDRAVRGCCCDNYNNCNVDLAGLNGKFNTSGPINNFRDYPISCFAGVFVENMPLGIAGWQSCQGECASATITTTFNGRDTNATLYTCDATSACYQLGLHNNCSTFEPGLSGCCCATDACIDPTVQPPRTPGNFLKCFVGIQSTYNGGLHVGAETYCDGQCAKLTGLVGGENVTTYHCVANSVCSSMELKDSCRPLWSDREVQACCCNNIDNCNVPQDHIPPMPPVKPDFPTACYSGLVVNNQTYSAFTLGACYGDCASISLQTQWNNYTHTATLYTCDPTSVCAQLNMSNTCQTIEPGVSGCCCDSDGCINPYTNTFPGPVNCYIGIYTGDGKINTGATVPCDGYCGSLETTVNSVLYKSYHCVPKTICRSLGLNNDHKSISTDREITGYCCTSGSNCHVTEAAVNATNVINPPDTMPTPIACRSSVFLNGAAVTDDGFAACYGQCASVSYATVYNGGTHNLTYFTCDPTSVCTSLGLSNSCATLDGGVSGCCCNYDNCVGPSFQPTPSPTGFGTSVSYSILTIFATVYMVLFF